MKSIPVVTALLALGLSLSACAQAPQATLSAGRSPGTEPARPTPSTASSAKAEPAAVAVDASLPKVLLHKSPTCGCCGAWGEHMRRHGFAVQVHETHELEPIRKRLGVPPGKGSCHTAEVGGLVVEGHVPASDIKRLLADRGDARGLTVPGMPLGSPGMEMPDGRVQPYTVERIGADGSTTPYARHGAAAAGGGH